MKKVIFLSAIALAAAVSCSKSEVVDTKFANEAIGFENYLGRDAQTKADVASVTSLAADGGIGIYGYYTGDPANEWVENSEANLLQNEHLYWGSIDGETEGWIYDKTAYWTNDTDEYTFFAYAPYGKATASQPEGGNPQIEYTLPQTLANQVDLVYSNNNKNITKRESVALTFSHALARLSVTANAVEYADGLTFTVTDIAISGPFNTKGTFDLAKGEWLSKGTPSEVSYDLTTTTGQLLTEDPYKFSEVEKNYMMMIPTAFSVKKETVDGKEVYNYDKAAKLTVTYTMTYKGATSKPVTKDVYITTPFEQGNAYVIKLTLQRDEANAIKFSVTSIPGWGTDQTVPVA